MNKNSKIWIAAVVLVGLSFVGMRAYKACGGVVSSVPANADGSGMRVVVRRIPFEKAESYEAVLLAGRTRMTSNHFKWDSTKISRVEVKWVSLNEFVIQFDGNVVRCTFVPWQSAEWKYGVAP